MARRSRSSTRSRRRSSSTSTAQQAQTSTTQTSLTTVTTTSSSRSTRRSSTRRRTVDTEDWTKKHLTELIEKLGLDFLGLTEDEYSVLLTRIVDLLRGEASTINIDTIARRFRRNLEPMYQLIASMLLEMKDTLTDEQLEFVVNNIGDAALAHAPRLYQELKKRGLDELIERLKYAWERAWINRRYALLPVKCPICGFHALMPDLTCLVCGSTVTEKQLKEAIDIYAQLRDYVKSYPRDVIETTLKYGYLYVTSLGLKPPTERRTPLDIEIILTSEEREYLKKLLDEMQT